MYTTQFDVHSIYEQTQFAQPTSSICRIYDNLALWHIVLFGMANISTNKYNSAATSTAAGAESKTTPIII